jgi:hypothetical protein
MKWLCKIRHKWYYYDNKVMLGIGHLTIQRRRCLRCYKIESQSLTSVKWEEVKPTIKELRDINLSKLGL